MARTLVQALEGVNFPCDRSRIVEYARQHDAAPRALEYLQQLPDQRFKDMTELFRALPAKSQRRSRLNVVEGQPAGQRGAEHQGQEEQPQAPEQSPEQLAGEEWEDQPQMVEGQSQGAGEQEAQEGEWSPRAPAQWQPLFEQGANQLCNITLQGQRFWLEWLNRSMEIYSRSLSLWMRR